MSRWWRLHIDLVGFDIPVFMSSNPFTSESSRPKVDRAAILAANPGIVRSAQWFWWILGLSLINTVLIHSGSDTSFAIGLGFTLVSDTLLQSMKAVALLVDAAVYGFFFCMGWFAVRGHRWAFLVGTLLYAGDGIIFLIAQDFVALAIHAWAIFALTSGGIALHKAIRAAAVTPSVPNVAVPPPTLAPPPVSVAPQPVAGIVESPVTTEPPKL